jgi:hypothetical protein
MKKNLTTILVTALAVGLGVVIAQSKPMKAVERIIR